MGRRSSQLTRFYVPVKVIPKYQPVVEQPVIASLNFAAAVNSCFRKKIFRSERNAAIKAAFHNKKNPPEDGKVFHAYYCQHCFHWHIGRTFNPR